MGSQIGVEYAIAGHDVVLVARDGDAAAARAERALRLVVEHDLAERQAVTAARERLTTASGVDGPEFELVIESLPEDLPLKSEWLRRAAEHSPAAILASNTSSLSITALGEAAGVPERTVGTHYLNPPLLMRPVEVIAGAHTAASAVARAVDIVTSLGKLAVRVERDVPGFVWNRLQMAVLRESLWLLEEGVARTETIDAVLRYGLGRRWSNVGFFRAIALGGIHTWQAAAESLLPELSRATDPGDLRHWVDVADPALGSALDARDRGLAADLRRDRGGSS
jgi:3-hydroxyacyl-CoA dehydrogenase